MFCLPNPETFKGFHGSFSVKRYREFCKEPFRVPRSFVTSLWEPYDYRLNEAHN
jgi:hypothetical protein